MTKKGGQIHIGTSGWSYIHWKGPFYPEALPTDQMLEYYAQHFHSVEINSSFYRLPDRKTLLHWYDSTPDDFLFTAKASRYITHMKKLGDPQKTVPAFLDSISMLDNKLGPILFQLPPRWHFNAERLRIFLDSLSNEFRYAFEFRDRSWLNRQTFELLAQRNMSFCIYELEGFITPDEMTTDHVYVRLHGPDGAYRGNYSHKALAVRAEMFTDWAHQGNTVWCYFDNDECGYAANNADQLQKMLSQQ
jgi:uncharacterized protein YecE (DUF72 family)